jgi:LSD1 subclass zinc finger protein
MIQFSCFQCRHTLRLKDELGGKKIRCPKCQAVLGVPNPPAAVSSGSGARAAPTDDITPYAIEPIQEIPPEKKDDRVDEMVKVANRQKMRNRAWNEVGPPAKYLKIATLIVLAINLFTYAYVTLASVLYLHKYEQYLRKVEGGPKSLNEIRWMWPLNEFLPRDTAPWFVFGVATGALLFSILLHGTILAGVESMKRLERYRLAMTAAILSIFGVPVVMIPISLWAIAALRKPHVRYEFEISRLRREGVEDPYEVLEARKRAEQQAQAEEDYEDEEEEEEEERPAPRRRRS